MWTTNRRRIMQMGVAASFVGKVVGVSHGASAQPVARPAGTEPAPNAAAPIVDANDPVYGIKCDGVTDDSAAWNKLLTSLSGSGALIRFKGLSLLSGPIHWRTKVSLQGAGWGASVLKPVDETGTKYFPAIQATYGNENLTLDDCSFSDFEIDGSGLKGTGAVISAKAIWIRFGRSHSYARLFLHDTIATALGSDFIPDSQIRDCRIERAGRNWTGHEGGHAGIGIGMGAWEVEPVDIVSNTVIGSGHWGIFVEYQVGKPYRSRGARIHGNVVTDTAGTGIADVGCTGTEISENTVTRSGQAKTSYAWSGIEASYGATGTVIRANTVTSGAGTGVLAGHAPGDGIRVLSNEVSFNLKSGICVDPGAGTVADVLIEQNGIRSNEGSGVEARCDVGGVLSNVQVIDNTVTSNGAPGSSPSSAGLLVNGDVTGMLIKANRFRVSRTRGYQTVALALTSGRLSSVEVTGNEFRGAGKASVVRTADENGVRFADNHGLRWNRDGVAAVRPGRRRVRVSHGLDVVPRRIELDPSVLGESVKVTRIGPTHFVVARRGRTTRALRFRWSAAG